MGEQAIGPQPVQSEAPKQKPKQETGKTVLPDVVKIGDSERRTPETSRAMNMVGATMEFLGDLGKANLAAKKELGELASTRIGKAIAVGAVGGGLEYLSGQVFGLAIQKLLPLLPSKTPEDIQKVKGFFNSRFVREAIEDAGVYALYQKGNELIGNELPKVPVSYLGAAVGVNALDWAVREKFGDHKPITSSVVEENYVNATGGNATRLVLNNVNSINNTIDTPKKQSFLDLVPRSAGKLADLSNPVTLYGTGQVIEGVSAYIRAIRDIRSARRSGGEKKIEMLLAEAKKAKPIGVKKDKQERILDVLEKAA